MFVYEETRGVGTGETSRVYLEGLKGEVGGWETGGRVFRGSFLSPMALIYCGDCWSLCLCLCLCLDLLDDAIHKRLTLDEKQWRGWQRKYAMEVGRSEDAVNAYE